MKRHMRDNYLVVGEGILTTKAPGGCETPSTEAELRKFRFSRLGPKADEKVTPHDNVVLEKVARIMTAAGPAQPSSDPAIPAGFTYLGQFVDHDLTKDATEGLNLGDLVKIEDLLQGRSPALDLDSLYGRGPDDAGHSAFYESDRVRLKLGNTAAISSFEGTNVDLAGYDLPRVGQGSKKSERQAAAIPDHRNDENLAVAQIHLAFMHFHNQVVDLLAERGEPSLQLFERAKSEVVKHYQWMLKTDYLTKIVDKSIVDDVFRNGRKFFEIPAAYPGKEQPNGRYRHLKPGDHPTMPIEFSVAAFRLGHSMVRARYNWNRIFADGAGTLEFLFRFSGTSGNFDPFADINNPELGSFERLPTNWAVDWRRMFDLNPDGNREDLTSPGQLNLTQRIDTLMVNPLAELPEGSFGHGQSPTAIQLNLAFRNLVRANMVQLASGQQMAEFLGIPELDANQIISGDGQGADLANPPVPDPPADPPVDLTLTREQLSDFASNTPLWFYILREAELNGGKLTGVGGRIVAEVFHRAIEGSRISIVREPYWRPTLAGDGDFTMTDLLLFAFQGKKDLLAPLGD